MLNYYVGSGAEYPYFDLGLIETALGVWLAVPWDVEVANLGDYSVLSRSHGDDKVDFPLSRTWTAAVSKQMLYLHPVRKQSME